MKLLRVNLTEGKIIEEEIKPEVLRNYIGGRGLGVKLIFDEVKAKIDPFSEENKIVFASGPLTGLAPACGKVSVVSKSPLTGTIFDCEMGGNIGVELRKAGYLCVIIEGKAEKPVYVWIRNEKTEIRDAGKIWGKTTSETEKELEKEGAVACIGPAGENLVRYACIMHKSSAAGRGGLGAVMGAKNLKAIVVKGEGKIPVANEYEFKRYSKELFDILKGHPITGDSLFRFGTPVLVNFVNKFGVFPVKNFTKAQEKVEGISGETISKFKNKNKACFGCPLLCKRDLKIDKKIIEGPEYESIWALGPNCLNMNLKGIIEANHLCNEYGLDTITTGCVIAFAMECAEKGKIKERLPWGDKKTILNLIEKIAKRDGIGNILAEGVKRAGEKLNASEFAYSVKGMELPAYDPRGVKGQALSYATSNRGGCHLRAYIIPQEILGIPVYLDNLTYEGKAKLVKRLQDIFAALDSLVICKFTTFAVFNTLNFESEIYAKLLTSSTGFYFDEKEFLLAGERIYNLERLFNIREGFSKKDDALPSHFYTHPIPSGPAEGQVVELEKMLEEYYKLRGWDYDGEPTEKKLNELRITYEEKYPKLQLALDLRERDEALRIAELAVKGGVDIIEAGTPLIKMCGMEVVSELRRRFPNKLIVADMKTMDTGYLETEMVAKAGGDISCVLGTADNTTIIDAVGAAKKYNIKIAADLIGIKKEELVKRAKELEKMGVDYICFHIGVDKQLRSDYEKIPFPTLRELANSLRIPIAAAGGLKLGTIGKAVKCGANIIIVGGAITRAGDPEKATKEILKEMKA